MDEQVPGADRAEHVGRLVVVGRHEPGGHDRCPARSAQVGPVEFGDGPEAGEVEHAGHFVAVVLGQADAAEEDRPGGRRHRPFDLEADGLAEPPPPELLLDGHEEVVRLVLLDRQVGVAGDPEEVRLQDLHAAEQEVEVGLDDLVDEDELGWRDLDEAGQDRRDLDPREPPLAGLRVAQADGDRQAERADVRERMAGIHGERREDREDLVDEALAQALVMLRHGGVVEDRDAFFGQLLADGGEQPGLLGDQALDPGSDLGQLLGCRSAIGRGGGRSGRDLLPETGHADLEELIEVAGEDGQELDPLQERIAFVARLVQHAGVEVEPGQLAIEVRRRGAGGHVARARATTRRAGGDTRTERGHGAADSSDTPGGCPGRPIVARSREASAGAEWSPPR